MIESQKKLIDKLDWDHLIILDACRYDIFSEIYCEYLSGQLKKVKSAGSCTLEWLKKTWGGRNYKNVVYISANPYCNSSEVKIFGFRAKDHFHKIIDVWDFGWDTEVNTVRPETVLRETKRALEQYPSKKFVIHYAQPHPPFLKGYELQGIGILANTLIKKLNLLHSGGAAQVGLHQTNIRDVIGGKLIRTLGYGVTAKIKNLLGLPAGAVWDVWFRFGPDKVKEFYEDNLRRALKCVKKSLNFLDGKIIITSDHGEIFPIEIEKLDSRVKKGFLRAKLRPYKTIGEFYTPDGKKMVFGHPANVRIPVLREVPWFQMKA